jgi:hypothetical protein
VKTSPFLLGALLIVATSCSDSTGPDAFGGSLSFSYSGATSGTFNASGSILAEDPLASTWAVGTRDEENEILTVAANFARSSNSFDDIVIDLPQLTTGTVTVANGATIVMTFARNASGTTAAWDCALTSGSVTVTSLSGTRGRGSFAGTGSCFPPTGAPVAFTVTNGSFDVSLVSSGF